LIGESVGRQFILLAQRGIAAGLGPQVSAANPVVLAPADPNLVGDAIGGIIRIVIVSNIINTMIGEKQRTNLVDIHAEAAGGEVARNVKSRGHGFEIDVIQDAASASAT